MKFRNRRTPETAERPPDALATRYTTVVGDRLARHGFDATEDGLSMSRYAYFVGWGPGELLATFDQDDGLHLEVLKVSDEAGCLTSKSPRAYCLGLNGAVLMYTAEGMEAPDRRLLKHDLDHLETAPVASPEIIRRLTTGAPREMPF